MRRLISGMVWVAVVAVAIGLIVVVCQAVQVNGTRTGRSLPILVRSRFELGDELPVDDRP